MCASRPFSLFAGAAVALVLAGFPPDGMAGQGQELSESGSGQSTEPPPDVGSQPAEASIAANLVPTDVAVAQKLQQMLAGESERIFERTEERGAAQAFYASRGYAPLWVTNGIENKHARSVISRLKQADNDGLDPTNYPIPDFKATVGRPAALAEAELILSKIPLTLSSPITRRMRALGFCVPSSSSFAPGNLSRSIWAERPLGRECGIRE